MRETSVKLGLLSLVCCAMRSGGCSVNRLFRNIWVGFGESVGAVPAAILIDYINSTFIGDIINPPDDEEFAP